MKFSAIISYVLIAAFAALGGYYVAREVAHMQPAHEDARSSTDEKLTHLGVTRPSSAIENAARKFGASQSLAFVGFGEEPTYIMTYYTIAYLTVPRQLTQVGCGVSGLPPRFYVPPLADSGTRSGHRSDYVAATFCHLVPCPAGRKELLAPDLEFSSGHIPLQEMSWTTFCSP